MVSKYLCFLLLPSKISLVSWWTTPLFSQHIFYRIRTSCELCFKSTWSEWKWKLQPNQSCFQKKHWRKYELSHCIVFALIKTDCTKHRIWWTLILLNLCSPSFSVVKFDHQSVVPVHLSAAAAKQWLETDLIFKIYSRNGDQKKVSVFGLTITDCLKGSAHI